MGNTHRRHVYRGHACAITHAATTQSHHVVTRQMCNQKRARHTPPGLPNTALRLGLRAKRVVKKMRQEFNQTRWETAKFNRQCGIALLTVFLLILLSGFLETKL
jgi:hypothetical protein